MTVTPSARSKTSILRVETSRKSASACATSASSRPAASPTAAADSVLPTWCRPAHAELHRARPAGVHERVARPDRAVEHDVLGPDLGVGGLADQHHAGRGALAIARTRGSSALSTATPSAGSASTSSPLADAMVSTEPNSPMCATPTLSTTPIRGGAISQRSRMWPIPRAPISSTSQRVSVGRLQHRVREAELVVERAGRRDRRAGVRRAPARCSPSSWSCRTSRSGRRSSCRAAGRPRCWASSLIASRGSATTIVGRLVDRPLPEHADRTGRERGAGEVVPVDALADERDEQPARADLARVVLDGAGHHDVAGAVQRAADDGRDLAQRHRDHDVTRAVSRVFAQGGGQLDPVVERVHLAGNLLAAFVALAEQRDHVARRRPGGPPR